MAALIVFFVAAPYALIRSLPLEEDEKLFFSLFIGLGVFPIAVWTVGRIIPSLRLALIATLILIAVISFLLQKKSAAANRNI